jgi:hypothetical protein
MGQKAYQYFTILGTENTELLPHVPSVRKEVGPCVCPFQSEQYDGLNEVV